MKNALLLSLAARLLLTTATAGAEISTVSLDPGRFARLVHRTAVLEQPAAAGFPEHLLPAVIPLP